MNLRDDIMVLAEKLAKQIDNECVHNDGYFNTPKAISLILDALSAAQETPQERDVFGNVVYDTCPLCGVMQPCGVHGRVPVTPADFGELTADVAQQLAEHDAESTAQETPAARPAEDARAIAEQNSRNALRQLVTELRERTWLAPVSAVEMTQRDRFLADLIEPTIIGPLAEPPATPATKPCAHYEGVIVPNDMGGHCHILNGRCEICGMAAQESQPDELC